MAVSTAQGQGEGKGKMYFVTPVSLDPAIEMESHQLWAEI